MAEGVGSGMSDPETLASAADQAAYLLLACEGADLTVTTLNAAARAALAGRNVVGLPLREAFADMVGQHVIEQYEAVYRTGQAISAQAWRVQLPLPDGSFAEVWETFSIAPWRHLDGRIRGVVATAIDVTKMVQARQAAEQRAGQLEQRYAHARDAIAEMQRELFAPGLPVLPGVQICASYLLAEADTAAGGDWFDALASPDRSVALVVGDVVGHGIAASAVMGQIRAVLHDRLDSGAGIAEALAAVDRLACRTRGGCATTICVAVLDPRSGALTYATAGHPPPLVVCADGSTRYLPATGAAPLGMNSAFPVCEDRLELGDMLLLYSDGILERPGRSMRDSIAELARVAADAAAGRVFNTGEHEPAARVCSHTLELLVRQTGYSDDITLLAAQRVPPPTALRLPVRADYSALRGVRAAFGSWLAEIGVNEEDATDLQHAVGELVTNAIEHGSRFSGAEDAVALSADLTAAGQLCVDVSDGGRWQEPSMPTTRGRGLALSAALVDSLTIDRDEAGTTAHVRHRLLRPARLLSTQLGAVSAPSASDGQESRQLRVVELAGDAWIRLAGPVDAATAQQLQHELLNRTCGGTRSLTLDLTEATCLASAGVAVLHAAASRSATQGSALRLYAPIGSPAQHVLALAALAHTTDRSRPAAS
jgi:serine phosphatase RsbU (regulator of sigma subunit)/anti-sigma regulatory factor (Ser/Thr protein kinase)/anti-anti-sigma regulatory factor